jgi:hypothetical protein
MADDAGAAQARELLGALHEHVADISHKLETAERRGRPASIRGALMIAAWRIRFAKNCTRRTG